MKGDSRWEHAERLTDWVIDDLVKVNMIRNRANVIDARVERLEDSYPIYQKTTQASSTSPGSSCPSSRTSSSRDERGCSGTTTWTTRWRTRCSSRSACCETPGGRTRKKPPSRRACRWGPRASHRDAEHHPVLMHGFVAGAQV